MEAQDQSIREEVSYLKDRAARIGDGYEKSIQGAIDLAAASVYAESD